MTFAELQAAVLAEGFNESDRTAAKRWLNLRGAKIYALDEDWTFRYATAAVTVTAGSALVAVLPTDLARPLVLLASNGDRLRYLTPERFDLLYFDDTQLMTGTPEAWTSLDGVLSVGPASNVTATDYRLSYLRKWVELADDGDMPGFPSEFHPILIHGAIAELAATKRDFNTAAVEEQMWDQGLDALRQTWLATASDEAEQWGSYADATGAR